MADHPLDLLVRRLEARRPLPPADAAAIRDLPFTRRQVPAATYLVREGTAATHCPVLVSGFAFRQKLVATGARQILSLHIPGEALDFQSLTLACVDHNVQTLTVADVAMIPMQPLRALVAARGEVAAAVTYNLLVEASIFREWLLNNGRRNARQRLAHLLCEFALRLDAQGLGTGNGYELPMTQEQLGDALGLTGVHVNRSIKVLEAAGLVARRGRVISFPDVARLRREADFDPLYLHLRDDGTQP